MKQNIEFETQKIKSLVSKDVYERVSATLGRDYWAGANYYNCDCSGEGLILKDDIDEIEVKDKKEYYHMFSIAFWGLGQFREKPSFWQRLKWCYRILVKNQMWEDQVMLLSNTAEKLANNILERIKKVKEYELNQNAQSEQKQ